MNQKEILSMEWINVNDRLPDELDAVLVLGETDNNLKKGMEVCWICGGDWTGWWTKNITHWMPLPEPPKKNCKLL